MSTCYDPRLHIYVEIRGGDVYYGSTPAEVRRIADQAQQSRQRIAAPPAKPRYRLNPKTWKFEIVEEMPCKIIP